MAILCLLAVFLLFAYGNNLISLYIENPHLPIVEWAIQKLEIKLGRTDSGEPPCCVPRYANMPVPAANDTLDCGKKKDLARFSRNLGDPNSSSLMARRRRAFVLGVYIQKEISGSFLDHILWLVFGNLYGIFQIIGFRSTFLLISAADENQMTLDENKMTSGQVVSLLLLGLLVLAVGEIYYGQLQLTTLVYCTQI